MAHSVVHCVSKKFPSLKLSVTLSNLNHFKFFCKTCDITHLTLGMLLHYLGKLNIQIFCRYSADMEENANKLHFKCTNYFRSPMRVTVYSKCIYVFIKILSLSLNTMLIVDKHCSDVCCDEFPVSEIDRNAKQVKEQRHGKFYFQSVWGNTSYFKRRKYHNLWMNNKIISDKSGICLHFHPQLLNIGRKFEFFNFPR